MSGKKALAAVMIAGLFGIPGLAQLSNQPKQEKLLNGLKILMWPDAKADKVYVSLRIHAGAAFDPQGKEGLMKMLAANFLPLESAGEFFTEDLGGSLDIETTYDFIQVNASSKPESILTLLETLASAVSDPPIDKEMTEKLRTRLIDEAEKMAAEPPYVADEAVAARLFGTFPYGRPIYGTQGSLRKIEFADLLGAKQRFLTADNATLAIWGNFDRSLALRAMKRYFGSWLRSDRRVPSTFRQPEAPPTAIVSLPSPKPGVAEIRYAFRGVARSDKEFAASLVFTKVLEDRLRSRIPAAHIDDVVVRNEAHTLPGMISIGFTSGKPTGEKLEAVDLVANALSQPVTEAELQSAKTAVKASWAKRSTVNLWLDGDTYQISNLQEDSKVPDAVTLSDVKAFAAKLDKAPVATVLVNTPAK